MKERIDLVTDALQKAINQPDARVKVQRWYPGVVEEITESVHEKDGHKKKSTISLEASLLKEASANLNRRQSVQLMATKERSVKEILEGMGEDVKTQDEPELLAPVTAPRPRRRRQKMRSTPVVGGGLFDAPPMEETSSVSKQEKAKPAGGMTMSALGFQPRGRRAKITVDGEVYDVRLSEATLKSLRNSFSGEMLGLEEGEGLSITPDTSDVTHMLRGYVRNAGPLTRITEDENTDSETSSVNGTKKKPSKKVDEEPILPV